MRKIEKINALAREMCDRTVPCDECNFNVKGPYCMAGIYAKKVINMGYSKVGEDEQVVKKTQMIEELNAAQESGKRMGYAQGRDEAIAAVLEYIDDTIKWVRKIEEDNEGEDEDVRKGISACVSAIEETLRFARDDLAKKYGVEE